jgi:1,4-dihydroxy-2-naphthoyl-CoA hydrolase
MAIAADAPRIVETGAAEPRRPQLDLLEQVKETRLPFAELLGIEFVAASPEKIVGQMTVREDLCTNPAVLHGGAVMAFADTLGAVATIVNLPQGAGTTTIESKTNFVASAPLGKRVIGETSPIHRGRRTMVWQTRISTEEGRLVALVTQTQLVL